MTEINYGDDVDILLSDTIGNENTESVVKRRDLALFFDSFGRWQICILAITSLQARTNSCRNDRVVRV